MRVSDTPLDMRSLLLLLLLLLLLAAASVGAPPSPIAASSESLLISLPASSLTVPNARGIVHARVAVITLSFDQPLFITNGTARSALPQRRDVGDALSVGAIAVSAPLFSPRIAILRVSAFVWD